MRAAVLHGLGDLRVEEIGEPVAGAGEVVLRIDAALTCGTDVKAFSRGHPVYGREPGTFGHEFAGTIVEVGAGVERFALGDRVFASDSAPCEDCFFCARGLRSQCEDLQYLFGGFAERLRVPARHVRTNLHLLPDNLPAHVAALAEPLASAVKAAGLARIEDGGEVAVIGGGGLGLMLCAVLTLRGFAVTVLAPHPEHLELARAFGAVRTLEATRGEGDVAAVRAGANGGRGPDHVFEAVGRVETWELACAMARKGGTVHLFGGCRPGSTFTVPTARPHYDEVRMVGSYHHDPGSIAAALALLAEGRLPWERLIGPRIALEQLGAALAGELEPRASKYLVVPTSDPNPSSSQEDG